MVKVHLLSDRHTTNVRMFCGRGGYDYGSHEFTMMDGIEARLEYADDEHGATCKTCLAAAASAAKRRE
jgi:hypothetical protein